MLNLDRTPCDFKTVTAADQTPNMSRDRGFNVGAVGEAKVGPQGVGDDLDVARVFGRNVLRGDGFHGNRSSWFQAAFLTRANSARAKRSAFTWSLETNRMSAGSSPPKNCRPKLRIPWVVT